MDFITEFFINPITSPVTQGYNLVNTSIFLIILILACGLIYLLLKNKVEFNYNFLVSLLPYILFGISLRVIMHQIEARLLVIDWLTKTANPLELGFWFFTPGIWILTFVLVIIGLLIGKVWKKLNTKRVFYFGIIVLAIPLLFNFSRSNNWFVFAIVSLLIIGISYLIYYLVDKYSKYKIRTDKTNFLIILGQGIDGIASAIAISFFAFSEQHVFSNVLMNIHPGLFAGVKLLIAVLICYSLDDYAKEQKDNPNKLKLIKFVKIIIVILGLATGLASLFKLGII